MALTPPDAQQNPAPARWETIRCPVCGSDSFTSLFRKSGEPFVRCNSCTLVLINPRPVYDRTLETYSPEYSENYAVKAAGKLRRCRRWVGRVKKRFGSGGRWLDIGCSVGFVVRAANDAGYAGYGVDIEPWGIEFGRKKLSLENLYQGSLESQQFPDQYFSVISLYDVIEHVPDLNAITAELKRILKQDGVIDIITPDVGHWRVPRNLEDWPEIKPSEHLYYFDRTTLSRLLANHGLRIVKKRFYPKPALRVYVQHAE